tara:strand:- start:556 stop:708 length:153 start_codon:yes stop_codon:yes gene_type:complete
VIQAWLEEIIAISEVIFTRKLFKNKLEVPQAIYPQKNQDENSKALNLSIN